MKSLITILALPLIGVLYMVLLLAILHMFVEARMIPSSSMNPNIQVGDRILVEKVKTQLGRPYVRDEIIVFYPPALELGEKDLSNDWPYVLGRISGLDFFPKEPAFIKRIIGLPGDKIAIKSGLGVLINGQLIDESDNILEPANYDLEKMGDIHGVNLYNHKITYETDPAKQDAPIVVPAGHYFVLGDTRNRSEDSHVFGFVPQERIIGRVFVLFRKIDRPSYPPLPQ